MICKYLLPLSRLLFHFDDGFFHFAETFSFDAVPIYSFFSLLSMETDKNKQTDIISKPNLSEVTTFIFYSRNEMISSLIFHCFAFQITDLFCLTYSDTEPCNIFFSSVLNCLLLTYFFYLFASYHSVHPFFSKFHEHLYDQYFEHFIMYIKLISFHLPLCWWFLSILLIGTYSSASSVCLILCMFLCIRYVSCVSSFEGLSLFQGCPVGSEVPSEPRDQRVSPVVCVCLFGSGWAIATAGDGWWRWPSGGFKTPVIAALCTSGY